MPIEFQANATQRAFIESRAEADLFSSRKGEGKSAALCWSCFYHTRANPGAPWALIRDTWENLQRTTLQEFMSWFPPAEGWGEWNNGRREYTWKPDFMGGAVTTFMGMDERADASKVASMPLAGIGMDEPCPADIEKSAGIDEFIFTTAMGQLRWPKARWYACKLAQNNSDEHHWTFRRFIDPGTPKTGIALKKLQVEGFKLFQPNLPENLANLPPGYYERQRREYDAMGRPDLVARFVEGKVTNQMVGKVMTPEWRDDVHLAPFGLRPVPGYDLVLCWDWGLTPTCLITQITPSGCWNFLDAFVGDGVGAYQLIRDNVKPWLQQYYRRYPLTHIGDPAGKHRDQSDSDTSPVQVVLRDLGGTWRDGPMDPLDGLPALKACLSQVGRIRVDKQRAKALWHALRGGWHRNINRQGIVGTPIKDLHSHPAEAACHAAPVLFPLGKLRAKLHVTEAEHAVYFQ